MLYDHKISGVEFDDTQYLPSKSLICLADLILYVKCDSHLKICHMIFDLKCKMFLYSQMAGRGTDNDECIQLFNIASHRSNADGYAMHPNKLFFRKDEVSNVIKNDSWITFTIENSVQSKIASSIGDDISISLKKTIFLLTHYYDLTNKTNIRFVYNQWSFGYPNTWIDTIQNRFNEVNEINRSNIFVDYLQEYSSDISGYIDSFEEAKKYARINIPSSEKDEIKLIFDLKDKFKLSNRKIAKIVYQDELLTTDIDTLEKRVLRKLKKRQQVDI